MPASKKRCRGKTNNNLYTVIICALGLILLILCIILISRSCSGQPSANASPSGTSAPSTAQDSAAPSPNQTQELSTLTAEATSSVSGGAINTQSAQSSDAQTEATPTPQPINLNSGQVLALHITIDTGYSNPGSEIFDDYYSLSSDYEMSMDAGNIKVVVFISDYRGNSTVRFFENMNAACIFSSFTFSDRVIIRKEIPENAQEMSITYDKAGTANIEWAGQSLAALIDGEAGGAYELSSSFAGKTVKLKIDNLGIMEKDVIFP